MGTSRTVDELIGKLKQINRELNKTPYEIVEEASLHVKKQTLALAPKRLSGVGKRGARLNVRYNISRFEGISKSKVFAVGPWQLIERDTRAHRIPRERTRGRQRYAVIPNVGVRAYANHPGTKGKHPWDRGIDAAVPKVRRLLSDEAIEALRRVF